MKTLSHSFDTKVRSCSCIQNCAKMLSINHQVDKIMNYYVCKYDFSTALVFDGRPLDPIFVPPHLSPGRTRLSIASPVR